VQWSWRQTSSAKCEARAGSATSPPRGRFHRRSLWADGAIAFAIVLIAGSSWWFAPRATIELPHVGNCDLNRGPCTSALPSGGSIELAIEPRPVPVLEPLALRVRMDGIQADAVEVDFAGVGMNMGYNRPRLARAGPDEFTGSATLPVCITGAMAWDATVLVQAGRRTISAPFRFEARSPAS
jgi:hypothetical protein